MPVWIWWIPLGLVLTVGALMAFRLGWIDAHLTESAAIQHYAGRYVAQTGGVVSDCTARPGTDTWLSLRCQRDGEVRIYGINRFGGLVREEVE